MDIKTNYAKGYITAREAIAMMCENRDKIDEQLAGNWDKVLYQEIIAIAREEIKRMN